MEDLGISVKLTDKYTHIYVLEQYVETLNTGYISYLTLNEGRLGIIKGKPILPFEKWL